MVETPKALLHLSAIAAVRGQFDDLESPGWDALRDETPEITCSRDDERR